jgi:type II secretory pathway component PulF
MSMFSYKAIDMDGLLINGNVDAETIDDARSSLLSGGLSVISIRKAGRLLAGLQARSSARRIKRRDIIELVRNIGVSLKAGITILDALEDVALSADNKALKNAMYNIRERITSGSTLSDAFNAHGRIFPDILIRMIRIGEETGRVELSLLDVADHLQRVEDLSDMVKRALMYPVFVLFTTGGALVFWLIYVMPKLLKVIGDMGVKLPLITRVIFFVSTFFQTEWYLIPLVVTAFIVALMLAKRKEVLRYYINLIMLHVPIVKLFVHNKYLASFAEQMKIMTSAGITIDKSLIIVSNSVGSEVFRRALVAVKEKISAGGRISEAIKEHAIFPRMVVRMIDVGEASGNLSEQFAFLSSFYFKKLDDVTEKLGKLIEPIMMTIVGVVFALMIMGILLPIYDLVSKFK